MKLSEAIRLGAMMGPQTFGFPRDHEVDGSGCALYNASKAAGLGYFVTDCGPTILNRWPWLTELVPCPACDEHCAPANTVIAAHLNDRHRWTRERIADWVQTIEPAEVHASETNGQCSLGKGPIGPSLEEINAVTITK